MVVEAWLARAAAQRPGHIALQSSGESRSYGELYAAALTGSRALRELGAGPGARVAIALPPGLEFAIALHSCLLLGAVAVPLDLRLARAEREVIAEGCAAVLAEPLPTDPGMPSQGEEPAGHDLDATAVVIHTSGTTAAPRPVELTYGNLLWSALGSAVALGLDPAELWLCTLPLSHVGGLSILVRSAIYATTAEIHERFDAERVLAALAGEVTLVSLVATTLARLLDAGLEQPPSLRCALTGGGPVPAARS
ncbi:MAG TPA: AMP-binding protein, partial [Solirubrobacteraceae bacterium]